MSDTSNEQSNPEQVGFLQHLHAFRGFAIVNVVAAHCWSFMIFWTGDLSSTTIKKLFWFTETLFHGSTIYFAVISGVLFSQVLYRQSWQRFFKNKLVNVLLPYCVVSLLTTWFYWQYVIQSPEINNTLADFIKVTAQNWLTGSASIHFWYIPVLMVLFLLTPLLAYCQKRLPIIAWSIALLPLIISRSPFPDFIKPQTFVYFIGAYMLGMIIGAKFSQLKTWLANKHLFVVAIAITSSILLFLLYLYDYQPTNTFSVRQTIVYIQKTSMSVLVLYWFSTHQHRLPNWLLTLGSYAFAIFFLHVIFMAYSIEFTREWINASRTAVNIALAGGLNLVVGILGSLAAAYLVKQLLGKHARKVIGA